MNLFNKIEKTVHGPNRIKCKEQHVMQFSNSPHSRKHKKDQSWDLIKEFIPPSPHKKEWSIGTASKLQQNQSSTKRVDRNQNTM